MKDAMLMRVQAEPIKAFCNKCACATERAPNGRCRPCAARYAAKWREAHPEKAKEVRAKYSASEKRKTVQKAWVAANPQSVKAKARKWYSANRERFNAQQSARRKAYPEIYRALKQAYRERNPEAYRIEGQVSSAKRRARKREVGGHYTADDVRRLLIVQKRKCAICKCRLGLKHHVDHVMPLALGGSNAPQNLQILCPPCNRSKGAKHPVDFMQQLGYLL